VKGNTTVKNKLGIVAMAILLTGCASHWEAMPDQPPTANFEQDQARCYLIGRGMPQASYAYAGGGTGRAGAYAAAGAGLATLASAIGVLVQQQEDRDNCMVVAGWHKVKNQ
jgi:hypothetical protein